MNDNINMDCTIAGAMNAHLFRDKCPLEMTLFASVAISGP